MRWRKKKVSVVEQQIWRCPQPNCDWWIAYKVEDEQVSNLIEEHTKIHEK